MLFNGHFLYVHYSFHNASFALNILTRFARDARHIHVGFIWGQASSTISLEVGILTYWRSCSNANSKPTFSRDKSLGGVCKTCQAECSAFIPRHHCSGPACGS